MRGRALTGSTELEPELVTYPARGDVTDPDRPPPCIKAATALRVRDEDAVRLVRLRLGLPVVEPRDVCGRRARTRGALPATCPARPASALRATWHALSCPYGGATRRRHDRVAALLRLLCLEIEGATVDWVPHNAEWQQENGEPGEPDLLVRIPGWPDLYIDVTIVSPTPGSPGNAAADAECDKERKYPAWKCKTKASVDDFDPAAWEAYGRAGPTTELLIARLAERCATDRRLPVSLEITRWRELLSSCVMVEQARMIAKHR